MRVEQAREWELLSTKTTVQLVRSFVDKARCRHRRDRKQSVPGWELPNFWGNSPTESTMMFGRVQ